MAVEDVKELRPPASPGRRLWYDGNWHGEIPFKVPATTANPDAFLVDVVARFPLGSWWSPALPELRVIQLDMALELQEGGTTNCEWRGRAIYGPPQSGGIGTAGDINYWYENTPGMIVIRKDRNGNFLSDDSQIMLPIVTESFFYERTECDLGYWIAGQLVHWSGAQQRITWGRNSEDPDSQRSRLNECVNHVNQGFFLGAGSEEWLCRGASAQRQNDAYAGSERWLVRYAFERRIYITDAGSKHWKETASDEEWDVFLRADFNRLELVWRDNAHTPLGA